LDIFPLISLSGIVSINELTLIMKIIHQYDVKQYDVTKKSNIVRFEGLDIQYH